MKRSHTLLLSGLVLAAAALVIAFWATRDKGKTRSVGEPPSDSIRIAVILNLSGPAARFDAIKQQAVTIAVERMSTRHPTLPLAVRVFDAGAGPEETLVAVGRALDWRAGYVFSGTSPTALAIASRVRGRNPPVVQMANAANPDFGPPRPGEYRLWPDWKQEAELIEQMLSREGLRRVLLIHSADPYSNALKDELTTRAARDTVLRLQFQQYDPASTPDFRPALLRAKQQGAQALVVFGLPPGIRSLVSQLDAVGWDRTIVGGLNINLAKAAFDSAGFTGDLWAIRTEAMTDTLPPGSEAAQFRESYRRRFGEPPPFHALYLADGIYLVANSLTNRNSNVNPVERLRQVGQFQAASGHVTLTPSGDLRYRMVVERLHAQGR